GVLRGLLKIPFDASELVVLEEYREHFLGALTAAGLEAVEVVPAVLMEGVADDGGTEDEVDLLLGQAGAKLIDHFLGDDVPLRNVDAVDAGKGELGATTAVKGGEGENQGYS